MRNKISTIECFDKQVGSTHLTDFNKKIDRHLVAINSSIRVGNSMFKFLNPIRRIFKIKKILFEVVSIIQIVHSKLIKITKEQQKILAKIEKIESEVKEVLASLESNKNETTKILLNQKVKIHNIDETLASIQNKVDVHKMSFTSGLNQIDIKLNKFNKNGLDNVSDLNLIKYYSKSFHDKFRGNEEFLKKYFQKRYSLIFRKTYIEKFHKVSCLDVGCGYGMWMQILKNNNHSVTGLELNRDCIDTCLQKKLKVHTYDIFEYVKKELKYKYNLITCFHVIEHFSYNNIIKFFETIKNVISDDGYIVVELPNIGNPFVSSTSFYNDPTHRSKLTYEMIEFILLKINYKIVHKFYLDQNNTYSKMLGFTETNRTEYSDKFDHMNLMIIIQKNHHDESLSC